MSDSTNFLRELLELDERQDATNVEPQTYFSTVIVVTKGYLTGIIRIGVRVGNLSPKLNENKSTINLKDMSRNHYGTN